MEKGDLATWETRRIIVVLEGVLTTPTWSGRIRRRLDTAEDWGWQTLALKQVVTYCHGNVSVEVVTFLGEQVAEAAEDWLRRYDVPVSDVYAVTFEEFSHSLMWRLNDVERVADSVPDRLQRYGQLGYATALGGRF